MSERTWARGGVLKVGYGCGASVHEDITIHTIQQFITEQTQTICITLVQRRPSVEDAGPTLYKCYKNVLCLLVFA